MQSPLQPFNIKTLHLKISVIAISVIAVAYGLYPNNILPKIFDFKADTVDLKNILSAIMGLYLGMVVVWITGIIKPSLWLTATITNIVFMGGLAVGRLISLLFDGPPGFYLLSGLIAELILTCWGIFNLYKYSKQD
jgi:hypothetical protein